MFKCQKSDVLLSYSCIRVGESTPYIIMSSFVESCGVALSICVHALQIVAGSGAAA